MPMNLNECPIWGTPGKVILPRGGEEYLWVDSERTRGKYEIDFHNRIN